MHTRLLEAGNVIILSGFVRPITPGRRVIVVVRHDSREIQSLDNPQMLRCTDQKLDMFIFPLDIIIRKTQLAGVERFNFLD